MNHRHIVKLNYELPFQRQIFFLCSMVLCSQLVHECDETHRHCCHPTINISCGAHRLKIELPLLQKQAELERMMSFRTLTIRGRDEIWC